MTVSGTSTYEYAIDWWIKRKRKRKAGRSRVRPFLLERINGISNVDGANNETVPVMRGTSQAMFGIFGRLESILESKGRRRDARDGRSDGIVERPKLLTAGCFDWIVQCFDFV